MKFYIEAWKAKQAWLDMDKDERTAYISQLAPGLEQLIDNGAEVLTWGENDDDTQSRMDYDFFSVLRLPSAELAATYERLVAESGWQTYFEQVNIKGDNANPNIIIDKLIAL